MKNNNKLLLITTLSFLLLIGCKESNSQVSNDAVTEQSTTFKKRPNSPAIKVMRELLATEPGEKPYVVEETNFNADGNITLISKFDYYGSGRKVGTITNTYSSQGNLTKSVEDDDGTITTNSYTYNAKNQKLSESWSRENGQGSTSQFSYDQNENLIEEKVFTADMKEDFSRVIDYEYDLDGNILVEKKREKYIDGSVDLLQYHFVQEFTDDKLILKVQYNEAGNPTRAEEYIYNELGQNITVVEGSSLGKHKTEYSYNEYGEMTDEKISSIEDDGTEDVSIHNVIRYDEYGNNLGSVDRVGENRTKTLFEYEF